MRESEKSGRKINEKEEKRLEKKRMYCGVPPRKPEWLRRSWLIS
jgi:hypothetical protein